MTKSEREQFFTNLSIEAGMMINQDTAKYVYYAITRLIQQELPKKKILELPDLGTFKLIPNKTGVPVIRFSTDYKLKYFCRNTNC